MITAHDYHEILTNMVKLVYRVNQEHCSPEDNYLFEQEADFVVEIDSVISGEK